MTTFLGTPGFGNLRGEEAFPAAARRALRNAQMRRNVGHATRAIRTKRLAAVAECRTGSSCVPRAARSNRTSWPGCRSCWRNSRPTSSPAVVTCTGPGCRRGQPHHHRPDPRPRRRRGGEGEIDGHPGDRPQRAPGGRGIAAIETDLAELIVQLGHDKPSHILVPAIHRNRGEIREIFARAMPDAADLTDEPHVLAMAARAHLRRKFLSAKVAVSGANFGVAETGTLAVVESEGNGRMCLTLPDTLITVMGIEKVVPRFTDLEVFMQLLPRSSTAERMNPTPRCGPVCTRGRPAGLPPGAARQRPHAGPRRSGGPRRPALHPVQRLPERVPGVRAHRRARLRLGVSRTDRGDPEPATDRHRRPR